VSFEYSFELRRKISDLNISINIYSDEGMLITTISTLNGDIVKHIHNGTVSCKVTIADLSLNPGNYVIVMPIHEGHSYLFRDVVGEFKVIGSDKLTWGLVNFAYSYSVG
jgi:hypothetical protein